MAVTRIKNNQITDATIVANSKVVDYSISSAKLANNLTYGSDLTITGNLTVNGNTTTIDTTITTIEDPVILLASGQTSGTPTVDIGFIGSRGNVANIAFVWDESADEFITAFTSTGETNTTISISSYANFHTNDANIGGNLVVGGNIDITGNVSSLNVTGNISGGNLLTPGLVSATSNVTGGNILTGGLISATATITGGNIDTGGTVSASGNVTGANINTGGLVTATGNISGGNLTTAGKLTVTGNINTDANIILSGTGNIDGYNAFFTNNVTVAGTLTSTSNIVANTSGIFYGNSVTGNGAIFGGVPGYTSLGSNVVIQFAGNANSYSQVNFQNISDGTHASTDYIATADNGDDSNYYIDLGINSSTFDDSANYPGFFPNDSYVHNHGGNLLINPETAGKVIKFMVGGTDTTDIIATMSNTELSVTGTTSVVGNITGGNLLTGGLISATATITGGNLATGGTASATGNITGGNVLTGGQISATANITGGNVLTGGLISATGNVTGGNVNTDNIVGTGLTITSTGALNLAPTGNITANSKNINSLADPVQDQDAATKAYVDSVAQGLDIKASVVYATTTNLPAYTYNNGTSGVGATLTAQAVGNLTLDGTVVSAGQRVLIKNEVGAFVDNTTQSAAFNGIYTVTTAGSPSVAYVLTRTTDFDNGSPSGEIPGAFTFVEHGATEADTGWVCTTNAPVTVGTTQIIWAQFSGAGSYTAGNGLSLTGTQFNVLTDGNANPTTAINGSNQVVVPANAEFITPNIGAATGTSLSATANVTGGNLLTGGLISATSNITGGNVLTGGIVSATSNITGGNVLTGGLISATSTITSDANITGANLLTGGLISATSNITGGNVLTGGIVSATANVTGGNILTGGLISATATITGGNIDTGGTVSATGNVTGGNILSGGSGSFTGNVTAANFFGNIAGNIDAAGSNTQVQFNDVGDILGASAAFTFDKAANLLTVTGNIQGANLLTGGLISATGTITADANVIGGNITTGGQVSATGNVTGGNVIGVTSGVFGNVTISASQIDSNASRITVNGNSSDVDLAVNGDTVANVFYVDAGTGTASFGTSAQITNALVAFNSPTSILMPVGNTGQRPGTGVTGMLRFNTTDNNLEIFDNSSWSAVGVPSFTVIADDQFSGDGSTVAFTLATAQTTNSCIVSINGVVQIPTSAYSVSGTTLTFTEAPLAGDFIDVREITTTTTVTSISNGSGNAEISVSDTSATIVTTGNIIPVANVVYSLGNSTNRFANLWLAGNTLTLGTIVMKDTGGQVGFFESDGTTPATIDAASVDTTTIANGTSNVKVVSSGGHITTNVGGTSNVMVVSSENVQINGNLTVTGNATLSGNILGDRIQNGSTSFDIQTSSGNANISVAGTSNVVVFTNAGVDVTGYVSATGNLVGGNVLSDGLISTTATLSGNALSITNQVNTGTLFATGVATIQGNVSIGVSGKNPALTIFSTGDIAPTTNATANIGTVSNTFNTIFAKATSAQYADLAEKYTADAEYAPGTVVVFGGTHEVTVNAVDGDRKVAGVVSTNPSYIMNSGLEADHVATVALTGRVPTMVIGPVKKGDLMVAAGLGRARAEADPRVGTVIGKALEDFDGTEGTIEVVVGRF